MLRVELAEGDCGVAAAARGGCVMAADVRQGGPCRQRPPPQHRGLPHGRAAVIMPNVDCRARAPRPAAWRRPVASEAAGAPSPWVSCAAVAPAHLPPAHHRRRESRRLLVGPM